MTKPSTPSSPSSSTSSPGPSDHLPIPLPRPGSVGQLDPTSIYAVYRFYGTKVDGQDPQTPLATIISINVLNGFSTGTEYWKVENGEIQTSDYVRIRVDKQVGKPGYPPPFSPADASFTISVNRLWSGAPNNDARDGCQVQCVQEPRYALHFSYSNKAGTGAWKGEATFLNQSPDYMFKGEDSSYDFTKGSVTANSWHWAKDRLL